MFKRITNLCVYHQNADKKQKAIFYLLKTLVLRHPPRLFDHFGVICYISLRLLASEVMISQASVCPEGDLPSNSDVRQTDPLPHRQTPLYRQTPSPNKRAVSYWNASLFELIFAGGNAAHIRILPLHINWSVPTWEIHSRQVPLI